jgi:hypothetical protein
MLQGATRVRRDPGLQEVPMQTIVEDRRLPADIDAQPVVQAAAALKPTVRRYQDEIEREQRLSPELVEQTTAACSGAACFRAPRSRSFPAAGR